MNLETLGLIGNCQYSALISNEGKVVWCCLPRFDSEPVFGRLLDEDGGTFSVGTPDGSPGVQRYLPNTNVLETRFTTSEGSFRVLDFAPRFAQYDRFFRPTQLHRVIEPLDGMPRVAVRCEPRLGWSKERPAAVPGSNHIRYEGFPTQLRLTTDIPLSYIEGMSFALTRRHHLALTWGLPIEEPLEPLTMRFLEETTRYWQRWVMHCTVPPHYQSAVIRSALALKLHCFEDTGAIVAAMTTSIPEAKGSGRTWDYRYCWLRDAYYVLSALRQIGHFEEREQFIRYLINIAANHPSMDLAPLYRVDGRVDLEERTLPAWSGYEGEGPVRVGNAAAQHAQHDIFGEMVLALAPIYVDERFAAERSVHTMDLLCRLARKAAEVAGTPDAGIWEFRAEWHPQTFSSLMCWAAVDRVGRIATKHRPEVADEFRAAAERIQREILDKGYNASLESFVASYGGSNIDASLLQLPSLGFLPSDDPRLVKTVAVVQRELALDGWMKRYNGDPMGKTQVAFTMCTFWLVEALNRIGNKSAARTMLDFALRSLSPMGLIAEDYDPAAQRMWGNFPQAYSHVGLIHAAFAASPPWSDVT
jgi:GH15 family glucan-1,4-alpha-glucosidase